MRAQLIGHLVVAGVVACSGARPSPTPGSAPIDSDPAEAARDTLAGVRIILAAARSGDTVRVRGLCLRMGSRGALGGPPVTRSDWQLADVGDTTAVIWVTGERPGDCGYDAGSRNSIDLHGVVGVDSIGLGTGKVLRRFLWRLSPQ